MLNQPWVSELNITWILQVQEVPKTTLRFNNHYQDSELRRAVILKITVYSGRCRLIQVNDGGTPQTGSRKARHGAPSCPAPGQSCRQHGFVPANVCDNYTEYCLPGKLTQPSISGVFVESGSHRRGPSFSGLTLLCSPSRGPADTR